MVLLLELEIKIQGHKIGKSCDELRLKNTEEPDGAGMEYVKLIVNEGDCQTC